MTMKPGERLMSLHRPLLGWNLPRVYQPKGEGACMAMQPETLFKRATSMSRGEKAEAMPGIRLLPHRQHSLHSNAASQEQEQLHLCVSMAGALGSETGVFQHLRPWRPAWQ